MRSLAVALLALLSVASWAPAATGAGEASNVAQANADDIPADDLRSFARAARTVFRIRQVYASKVQAAHSEIDASGYIVSAQREMEAAIRNEGLTVRRYNEILAAAQRNGVLAARIQELVDKEAAGR
jgi:hypothetical protein